jgi:hypothetical protein
MTALRRRWQNGVGHPGFGSESAIRLIRGRLADATVAVSSGKSTNSLGMTSMFSTRRQAESKKTVGTSGFHDVSSALVAIHLPLRSNK